MSQTNRVIVRGAGEMASGVIRRLHLAGFEVLALEQPAPECIRRTVCFAEAVFDGTIEVEGATGELVASIDEAERVFGNGKVPVLVDPDARGAGRFRPDILVDARMLKEHTDSSLEMAPIVIGLGPGFSAGENCHAVIETNRGFNLGRVIYKGEAERNTGIPATVGAVGADRVLRSPSDGVFEAQAAIADMVVTGQTIGTIGAAPVVATIDGCLRGLVRSGKVVSTGQKIGDIDPRGIRKYCFLVSEKANAIAGGVLEAVFALSRLRSESSGD